MNPQDQSHELLTIREAAKLLTISPSSLRRLQQGRRIPFFKIGGTLRFKRSDVMEYVEKQRYDVLERPGYGGRRV